MAPRTIQQWRSVKKPRQMTVHLVGDDDKVDELIKLQRAANDARKIADREGADPREVAAAQKAERALDAAYEQAEEEGSLLTVTLKTIGRARFEALGLEHPPPEEGSEAWERAVKQVGNTRLEYDVDTFPPALIAACAVDPPMTLEEATELWNSDEMNQGELTTLLTACMMVNTTARQAPTR